MLPIVLNFILRLSLGASVALCAASPAFAQSQRLRSTVQSAGSPEMHPSDSFEVMSTDRSGVSVRVKVGRGAVELVEVNGESVPVDRASLSSGAIEVRDAEGSVVRRFDRPRLSTPVLTVSRDEPTSARTGPDGARRAAADAARSMVGVGLGEIDPALAHHLALDPARATLITNVVEELPAHLAGIERFDVIVGIDGSGSAPRAEVAERLARATPGTKLRLTVRRGAETAEVEVTTVAFDPSRLQADLSERRAAEEQAMLDLFFVGSDGVRRELRMPPMQDPRGMSMAGVAFERFSPEQLRLFERVWSQAFDDFGAMPAAGAADSIEQRLRRMEERLEEFRKQLERGAAKPAEPGAGGA